MPPKYNGEMAKVGDEEVLEVGEIEADMEVSLIKGKIPNMHNKVQCIITHLHRKIMVKQIIGIHHKSSVTHVVELGTTKMVVLFEVTHLTQTIKGLAKGATARPQILCLPLLHKKEMEE